MKKVLTLTLAVMLVAALGLNMARAEEKKFKIGVTVIVSHPALEGVQNGFEAALKDAGLTVEYDYQNAQGEMQNALAIAQKFAADSSMDLVHAIATPTAQAAVKAIKDKPIVYGSVTDPVGAGLVKTLDADHGNVTGTCDAWDIDLQISTYHEILPSAKVWGTVYNAGDQNSLDSIARTKKAMEKLGLKLVEMTVSNSSEVYAAAQTLVSKVDAIYITSDNTAVSAVESIAKAANDKNIPLFAGDTGSVERGAVMALGYNYYKTGYAGGELAAQILKEGKKPGDIPSIRVSEIKGILEFHLNLKAAKAQGLEVPDSLIQRVKDSGGKIYE